MTPFRWLALFIAIVLGICALAIAKSARAADLRLDIVQVDANGVPVSTASQPIVTFNYSTPVLIAYVRQDRVFGNGFDSNPAAGVSP